MVLQGSVVFIRSDWSKEWPDPSLAARKEFPEIKLEALKFLHLDRKILFHGHEALDTDTTPLSVSAPVCYLGSEYVPVQAQVTPPSAVPLPVQVPLALMPLNFPAPPVACHLLVPDSILPSFKVAVKW
jgi:kynurenine formamidase